MRPSASRAAPTPISPRRARRRPLAWGEALRNRGFVRLVSSDLNRAVRTAELMNRTLRLPPGPGRQAGRAGLGPMDRPENPGVAGRGPERGGPARGPGLGISSPGRGKTGFRCWPGPWARWSGSVRDVRGNVSWSSRTRGCSSVSSTGSWAWPFCPRKGTRSSGTSCTLSRWTPGRWPGRGRSPEPGRGLWNSTGSSDMRVVFSTASTCSASGHFFRSLEIAKAPVPAPGGLHHRRRGGGRLPAAACPPPAPAAPAHGRGLQAPPARRTGGARWETSWPGAWDILLNHLAGADPDVFLVELYPFGRKKFGVELLPVLEQVRSGRYARNGGAMSDRVQPAGHSGGKGRPGRLRTRGPQAPQRAFRRRAGACGPLP